MVCRMSYRSRFFQARSRGTRVLWAFTFVLTLVAAASAVAQAQTYSVLYSFGSGAHGADPWSGVVLDNAGNIYGTANQGGDYGTQCTKLGCGLVYELTPAGKETVLHKFTNTKSDGFWPTYGTVLRDASGDIYGTTVYGGPGANGIVYELKKGAKKETILHTFPSQSGDGAAPECGLIEDAAGNLYGTTFAGGASGQLSAGTVFKITNTGEESVLHSFDGTDGFGPVAGLVEDSAGNLYGTASSGGSAGWGTVFKISAAGVFSVLYNFQGYLTEDGGLASAGSPMVLDSAGNLYGVTTSGGDAVACPEFGCGVIFKLDSAGNETILHIFVSTDGFAPNGVIFDAAGNLWGTTTFGGAHNQGTIFKLDPSGNLTTVYSFSGGETDGEVPFAGLTQDSAGNFYGTTSQGGKHAAGVAFKLTP
jgi:uncharacterized repeat protein (TIGR03803 family)